MTIKQIIPATHDWFLVTHTEDGQSIYPVAVWALVDHNKVVGLIGPRSPEGSLAEPPSLETEYKHRNELNEGQLYACFSGKTYNPQKHQIS